MCKMDPVTKILLALEDGSKTEKTGAMLHDSTGHFPILFFLVLSKRNGDVFGHWLSQLCRATVIAN